MKVSLGMKLRPGPWGGGNRFGNALAEHLRRKGVKVQFDLSDRDLDLILLTDPRPASQSAAFSDRDIVRYILTKNRSAIVVHRVNECDERKGTKGVNERLIDANRCAEHTVFVSNWLMDVLTAQGLPFRSRSVIHNGADRRVFNSEGYRRWDRKSPLKLVTHHWSSHWMKGFDIYERLDGMLGEESYKSLISYTYIGNLPQGFRFRNARHLDPLNGAELAAAIRQNHVYVTASQNEPGGNHQNEGANCGLPLLYRESGCLPEYCSGFGVSFTADSFEEKLRQMVNTYDHWVERVQDYPHTAERMCELYYDLFVELLNRRELYHAPRNWWRQTIRLARIVVGTR